MPWANQYIIGAEIQLQKFPSPPRFTDKYEERAYLKGRLALAFRIFGKLGYDEGVAGHITLRDPVDPTTFWVNPFGVAFSMIKSSDLILVDHDGKVIDGGPCRLLNTAAYMIHAAVHSARPDVVCAAHSHSIYGRTYCALGKELDITTQDRWVEFPCLLLRLMLPREMDTMLTFSVTVALSIRIMPYTTVSRASSWLKRKAKILQRPLVRKRPFSCKTTVS